MVRFPALSVALLLITASPVWSEARHTEIITETGEGVSIIEGADYIDARQKAKDSAIQQALWKAVDALSPPEQVEKNRESISASIVAKGMNYVQSYKYAEEAIDAGGGTYKVSLEITFFADQISKALEKSGLKVAEKPKAVIILDERALDIVTDASFLFTTSPTEEMFRETISQTGLKGIGRSKVRALKNDAEVLKAVGGDATALKWLGSQIGAEIVVVGAARAKPSDSGEEMEGLVWVKVYDAASANLIWAKEATESVPGTNGADKFRAIRLCADKMNIMLGEFLATRKSPPKAQN